MQYYIGIIIPLPYQWRNWAIKLPTKGQQQVASSGYELPLLGWLARYVWVVIKTPRWLTNLDRCLSRLASLNFFTVQWTYQYWPSEWYFNAVRQSGKNDGKRTLFNHYYIPTNSKSRFSLCITETLLSPLETSTKLIYQICIWNYQIINSSKLKYAIYESYLLKSLNNL